MSIHDVDKGNNQRSNPKPNVNDVQTNRMAHNTMSTTYKNEGNTNTQRIAFKNNLILYYDDQDRIIRVDGFIPQLVDYPVTIIAKYGYDVFTDILAIDRPDV